MSVVFAATAVALWRWQEAGHFDGSDTGHARPFMADLGAIAAACAAGTTAIRAAFAANAALIA